MARRMYAGGAAAMTLASGINATAISISTTGTATGWPDGSAGKFLVVIDRGLSTEEKLFVNSRSGNTLTLTSSADRGADNTTAASHSAGAAIEHAMGAIDLDEPNRHINTTGDDNHTQYLNTTRHAATVHNALTTIVAPVSSSGTTVTTIASMSVTGNTLAVGDTFRYFAAGTLSLTSGQTVSAGLYDGSTPIAGEGLGATVSNYQAWELHGEATVRSIGATGTILGMGWLFVYSITNKTEGLYNRSTLFIPVVIDTTGTRTINLTMQLSSGSDSMTAEVATLELLQA